MTLDDAYLAGVGGVFDELHGGLDIDLIAVHHQAAIVFEMGHMGGCFADVGGEFTLVQGFNSIKIISISTPAIRKKSMKNSLIASSICFTRPL